MLKYSLEDIEKIICEKDIKFLRMQFTDVFGILKNVTVMANRVRRVMEKGCMFDGSSVEGFARIEESDMMLVPDINTFQLYPWSNPTGRTARFICDVYTPDGSPHEACPRHILKRQIMRAKDMGFVFNIGPECEFFMFERDAECRPTLKTRDEGGYFDLAPMDTGSSARRDISLALEEMGYEVETSHHECAPGQHEIDFKYGNALKMADDVMTFKIVVKRVALTHNLHATFMPKPIFNVAGSGMHVNISLAGRDGNAFVDENDPLGLSSNAYSFMTGIINHARGLALLTNPTTNSYKRLASGFEAPCYIAWSAKNRSPLIRVPYAHSSATRIELRNPDPTANPYLAFAGILAAGLEGIEQNLTPPDPVNENVYVLTDAQRNSQKIRRLPQNMYDAIKEFVDDSLMKEVLGESAFATYVAGKEAEWADYSQRVTQWEIDQYLTKY